MTRTARLRQLTLAVAVLGLLVGVPAQLSGTAGPHSGVAITTTGVIASGSGEAVDTRLQRDTKAQKGQRSVRQDGLTGPASAERRAQSSVAALAGVLERAGHPERIGHILLRGPPASSA